MRAYSITWNICAMPSWTSPTSRPRHGAPSPSVSSHVAEALMPIFFSTFVTTAPLRSPSEPSSFTQNFGTMNSDSPFVPGPAPSGRASTRWTMFFGRVEVAVRDEALHALELVLVALRRASRLACVPAPTSLPASGLGEHHRAAPVLVEHRLHVALLLRVGAECVDDARHDVAEHVEADRRDSRRPSSRTRPTARSAARRSRRGAPAARACSSRPA